MDCQKFFILFVFNRYHANPISVCQKTYIAVFTSGICEKNVEKVHLPIQFKFSPITGYDMTAIKVTKN